MSENKWPWLEPMGLKEKDLLQCPPDSEPLIWAIKLGLVQEDRYIQWASNHYQLPSLDTEFFEKLMDFSIIDQFESLHPWGTHCFPIALQNNQLFVASLEPVHIVNFHVVSVLTPLSALEFTWKKYRSLKEKEAETIEIKNNQESIENLQAPEPPMDELSIPPDFADFAEEEPQPQPQAQVQKVKESTITKTQFKGQTLKSRESEEVDIDPETFKVSASKTKTNATQPTPQEKTPAEVSPEHNALSQLQPPEELAAEAVQKNKTEDQSFPVMEKEENSADDGLSFSFDDLSVNDESEAHASQAQPPQPADHEKSSQPQNGESFGGLDFSNLDVTSVETPHEPTELDDNQLSRTQEGLPNDINSFGDLTSATQTIHARPDLSPVENTSLPDEPFAEISTDGIQLAGEKTQVDMDNVVTSGGDEKTGFLLVGEAVTVEEEIPKATRKPKNKHNQTDTFFDTTREVSESDIPSLDDLKMHQTAQLQTEESKVVELEELESQEQAFDDEDTQPDINPPTPTETNGAQLVHTPPENQITDQDLMRNKDMDHCQNLKAVMSHIFGHLKRDYKQLMWVGKKSEAMFFPIFVYGPWKVSALAWRMHINLANPNIFRIAYRSGQPFHGEVYVNDHNYKYLEWWTRKKQPDFATIYPVWVNESIAGFIVGFDKGPDFDEVRSLKKVENLVSLTDKLIKKYQNKLAA